MRPDFAADKGASFEALPKDEPLHTVAAYKAEDMLDVLRLVSAPTTLLGDARPRSVLC